MKRCCFEIVSSDLESFVLQHHCINALLMFHTTSRANCFTLEQQIKLVHKYNKFSAMPFRIPEVALNAFRACKTHRFLYVLKIKTRKYRVR